MKQVSLMISFLFVLGAAVSNTAVISGAEQTYSTLSGKVVDTASGEAIAGAVVKLGINTDTTDAEGQYSIDSVQDGAKVISVSAKGYVSKSVSLTMPAEAYTFDFQLVKIQYNTISGTIYDSLSGSAIEGAVVKIGAIIDTVGSDGKFSFDTLQKGTRTVTVTAEGYFQKNISITLSDSSFTLNIALAKIVYSTLSGTVVDSAAGSPIDGAIVRLGTKIDTVQADGNFSFDSVQNGARTIVTSAQGYNQKSYSFEMPDSNFSVTVQLIGIKYSTLSGTVVDSVSGSPIEGAIVRMGTTRIDTVQADGKFSFDSLRSGRQTVTVTAEGYYQKSTAITMPDSNLSVDILLAKTTYLKVSGTVADSSNGAAIGGAIVHLYNFLTYMKSDTADDSGKYTIDVPTRNIPNAYLYVAISGFTAKSIKVPATDLDTATIDIFIKRTGVLDNYGFIHGKEAISVERARVILTNIKSPGIMRLYDMKGKQLVAEPFPAGATFCLKLGAKLPAGAYMLAFSRKSGVFCKPIILH